MENELTAIDLQGPFDAHGHLRRGAHQGEMMHGVVRDVLPEFGGMVVMPNPERPIIKSVLAQEYQVEIDSTIPDHAEDFQWILTGYLTNETKFDDVLRGVEEGIWHAMKYYPANGSTNTASAVTDLKKIYPLLTKIQEYGAQNRRKRKIPILLHGEVVGDNIDPFDAERIFVNEKMPELQREFPGVTFVLEHISTEEAAWYVDKQPWGTIYATITPQHLLHTRKRIFQSGRIADGTFKRGLNPSMVCWPLLKEEHDRRALLNLIASGAKNVGAGTDRASHGWRAAKLGDCGAAGCDPGRSALGMYAMAFESVGKLKHYPDFMCRNIPVNVYELEQGKKKVRLVKDTDHPYVIPDCREIGGDIVVLMMHGEEIPWIISPVESVGSFH